MSEHWKEPWGDQAYDLVGLLQNQLWPARLAAVSEALTLARREVLLELVAGAETELARASRAAKRKSPRGWQSPAGVARVETWGGVLELLRARLRVEEERLGRIRQAAS